MALPSWLFHSPQTMADVDVDVEALALALCLGAGLRSRAGLPVGLVLGGLHLDDLGREQVHLLHPADRFVLAGNLERALALLAMRVHRHVVVFWHKGKN